MISGASSKLLGKLRSGSGTLTSYTEAKLVNGQNVITCPVLSAAISLDINGDNKRSASITVSANAIIIPDEYYQEIGENYAGTFADTTGKFGDGIFGNKITEITKRYLKSYSSTFHVVQVFEDGLGWQEKVTVGVFDVDDVDFDHDAANSITIVITGYDCLMRYSLGDYGSAFTIANNTNVRNALIQHYQKAVGPQFPYVIPTTSFTTLGITFVSIENASSVLDDAQKIAHSAGWVLDSTTDNKLTVRVPADPGTAPSSWSFTGSHLLRLKTKQEGSQIVNRLVIQGEDSNGEPVYGKFELYGGDYGIDIVGPRAKKETASQCHTVQQCNEYARSRMPAYQVRTDTHTITVPLSPLIEHGDVIDVTDEEMGIIQSKFIVEKVDHDYANYVTTLTISRKVI